ncbi:MAG TPA: Fic family protein [Candidatus Nanoarchaeia archaeon]|nr:Fic family protein [Candidatus Nanoarchaeia archaeon]
MVYLYKKTVGDKSYYYLRASVKKGSKILVKDIAYLGRSPDEIKRALEKLPKYSKQIRKAYRTINVFLESNKYMDKIKASELKKDDLLDFEALAEIEACRLHFNTDFKRNNELTKKEILKNFVVEFAFNTTSIEGNTINLKEARILLEEGLTPKSKALREIYDLQNTEKTFFDLIESKSEISHEFISRVHSELMRNIDTRTGYRTSDLRVIKSHFEPTPAPYVKADMDLLLKWYEKSKLKLHPFVLAVVFHHKFEKIHPFMDGNGRTGRLMLNFILMKNKYPPVIIRNKNRGTYLDALRNADSGDLNKVAVGDYNKLLKFVARELSETYWGIFL